MKIVTDSIINYMKDTFHKNVDDLLLSEILLVEYLTIDGISYDNKKLKVSFDDLKLFKNLRYLEIRDVEIDKDTINILKELIYLENLVFRNCNFKVKSFNELKNIRNIRIINCSNFDIDYINKLDNIKRVFISGELFKSLKGFNKLKLESLDISGCTLDKSSGIDKINTNYLVISSKQYKDFEKNFLDLDNKIMVMADPNVGYYIDKWIN